MPGPSKRIIYDAATAEDLLDIAEAGINGLCALLPLLDALRLATPRWSQTEDAALQALGVVMRDLADDVAHRAQLLARR